MPGRGITLATNSRRNPRHGQFELGQGVVGIALCSAALAVVATSAHAAPSLAGPSVASSKTAAVFSGTQFAPNTSVTIAIRAPSGAEAHYGAMVNAQGRLELRFQPKEAGMHSLRVLDSGGRQLSATNVSAMPDPA